MIIRPIHDILLLPDVSYYFRKEFFKDWTGEALEAGTEILFALLKDDKDAAELTEEDFYPIGLIARIEGQNEDENVQVRTLERVDITDLKIEDGHITAEAFVRPETADMTEGEEKERFGQMKVALLKFVQGYQWGLWARSFILQRKNVNDLACALSDYLNLDTDAKYEILAADSVRERYGLIEKAIHEFIEIAKVSEEAQNAHKDNQEQLYREAAIKKQIDYLQKELDDMHPENMSDVRKFEKKIARSGMNKEARGEAEKVLNRMRQEVKERHE